MKQEHRITYKAGITRKPSDFLCGDGELAECINLATDSEELKPMVEPEVFISNIYGGTILYIHKFAGEERIVGHYTFTYGGSEIDAYMFGTRSGTNVNFNYIHAENDAPMPYEAGAQVTSLGRTLIIKDSNGLHYFLWEKNHAAPGGGSYTNWYKFIGDTIPDPRFEFWIEKKSPIDFNASTLEFDNGRYVDNTGSSEETILEHDDPDDYDDRYPYIQDGKVEDFNDLVVGLYSKNLKSIAQKKMFCNPFAVKTALRLYDGSYTHVSQPIMMFPTVNNNTFGLYMAEKNSLKLITDFGDLKFTQTEDLTDWSDIVKEMCVFISDDINIYDTSVDQGVDGQDLPSTIKLNGIYRSSPTGKSLYYSDTETERSFTKFKKHWGGTYNVYDVQQYVVSVLVERPKDEIINNLKGISLFYRVADVGLEPVENKSISEYIETHTLENLTTQERLESDDYFSRCKMYPNFIHSYNSRLNLANVERGMFEGFGFFLPYDNVYPSVYTFFVKIKTDEKTIWVRHVESGENNQGIYQKQGIYFFYPDPRAKQVTIYKGSTLVCNQELTEHPALNGAYFFRGLPGVDFPDEVTSDSSSGAHANDPNSSNDYREPLQNYIITSEVNNPWLFKAEGYNSVGIGNILGVSTTTTALSQGQFGHFPLLVFSESGIWAMSVDTTGLYQSIYPMSRDVCLNAGSILQTDGAVFFVSKKGLMVVAGGDVRCVSEQMDGRAFNTNVLSGLDAAGLAEAAVADWAGIIAACQDSESFLEYIRSSGTFMAYDYIDSRIIITKPGKGYSYAYNIADGTISKVILPAAMTNAVNNYPDYLIQGTVTSGGSTTTRLYSLYNKKREEEVSGRQTGFLLTRPMKLAGPVSQASLRELVNVGTWDKGTSLAPLSCVKTEIFVSEDMKTWYSDISRFGAAARYYRLALYLKMLPTERLSGTILTEQERRGSNIRG